MPYERADWLWTVEEACRNAYPAREALSDGWLLRAAGGRSSRTNSVNPLRGGPRDPRAVVDQAEAVYASLGRVVVFRVPDLATEMDAPLDRLGYAYSAGNRTLWADADVFLGPEKSDVTLTAVPEARWFETWAVLNPDASPADGAAFQASVDAVLLPAAFVIRWVEGEPAALAYGVLDRAILVIEAVVTDTRRRRAGHARATLAALCGWARQRGARGACLQVSAENEPALALYQSIGFDRDLYGYHYRIAPARR